MNISFILVVFLKGKKVLMDIKECVVVIINKILFKLVCEQYECWVIYRQCFKSKIVVNKVLLKGDMFILFVSYDENVVSYYKVVKLSFFLSQSFVVYYNVLEYYFFIVFELIIYN